ncbi:MCE family protein [Actinomadura sp. GC306]|uniref:MCE family protein n=1 Tax=Actinomadura sp. GC306 TaxID=2530367 RepID=UPI0010511CD4|nr:MlaD family protein [Actinomadura sp. GC306]TDC70736.1 MCE family protein [Actinomadura sp. GC306]
MADRTYRGYRPHRVALIGVTGVVVAVLLTYAYGALGLGERGYTMTGVFTGAGGLKAGDEVQLAGVRVGRVESVRPDYARGHVIIKWKVRGGVDLGPRTRADVRAANLLGGQYLKLSGPVVRPYVASLPESRRRVPPERTSIPYTLDEAINSSTGLVTRLDTRSIDKILKEAAGIELPGRKELAEMLADLDTLTTTLNERAPEVQAVIAGSERLTSMLASKDRQLGALLEQAEELLDVLARRRAELAGALGKGSRAVGTLDEVISKHRADLRRMLDDMDHVLRNLGDGRTLKNLNIALAWIGPAAMQLSQTTNSSGRWLEGSIAGVGPLQPSLLGPQPSYLPPNYPHPDVSPRPPDVPGGGD